MPTMASRVNREGGGMRDIKFRTLVENKHDRWKHWEYYTTLCDPTWNDNIGLYRIIIKDLQFICQQTKGKDIYEEDFLKNREGKIYRVEWIDEFYGFCFTFIDEKGHKDWYNPPVEQLWNEYEIIGNSFENPELIKE